jgi:membrane-bound lytic murein transglycosylase MltF
MKTKKPIAHPPKGWTTATDMPHNEGPDYERKKAFTDYCNLPRKEFMANLNFYRQELIDQLKQQESDLDEDIRRSKGQKRRLSGG